MCRNVPAPANRNLLALAKPGRLALPQGAIVLAMLIGLVAVFANCLLWYLGIGRILHVPDSVFAATFFASFLLPIVAAWRSRRWWLFLSLSPLVLWALLISHVC